MSPLGSAGPLVVTVNNARYVATFPHGSEQLMSADVELSRSGSFRTTFEGILFAEDASVVSIYGVEFDDGYPKGLLRELALKQQAFIQFLRDQNRENRRLLGPLALLFTSQHYSSELAVTRAYLAIRQLASDAGVGYFDSSTGTYVCLAIESEHG